MHGRLYALSAAPASTFLPTPSIAASSRRTATVSSSDSFLTLEPCDSTYLNPFLSPASTVRWPTSPPASVHSSPGPSARLSPESALLPLELCAAPATEMESRAAREIRLQYED
ncbi:hypothetical protein MSAN_02077100 [Mycena sanguinolenta]|uniref:Uncharacterized protein n=1 Tax=Mycena sanguinolenta TaxID=230812 RepID=A0A8H6XH33_9AGAR|nr:hypothetical protein MSAN_02077100 [Mycena sanguinolenta]